MKTWYIVDMILTMIAACVERASCVSALFRQALDVREVDALRVWSSRKVPRPHFSLACEAITFLLSTVYLPTPCGFCGTTQYFYAECSFTAAERSSHRCHVEIS
jgi:hypothetical protein